MTRRLVIVDRYDSGALDGAARAAAAGERVDVLLLGLSPAWFRWQHARRAEAVAACRLLDVSAFAESAQALVRRFVPEYIAELPSRDLGGETLANLLRDADGNTWWYLEVSEKGPYRGPLVGQLYALALVRVAMERETYSDVVYSLRDPWLRAALATGDGHPLDSEAGSTGHRPFVLEDWPVLRYGVFAILSLLRLMAAWGLPRPRGAGELIPPGARLIFTAFPAWWIDATGKVPRERFFSAAGGGVAGYLALVTTPGALWRHRGAIRRLATQYRLVFIQHFLSWRDAALIFVPRRFRALVSFQRRLRPRVQARFAGFEVGPLVARAIARSLSGPEPFQDVLLARAMRRAVASLAPSMLLYRAEFQPAENAMLRGAGSGVLRVGFVHFPFGRNYLPIRFAPGEVSSHIARHDDPDARPFPDRIITSGEAIAAHVAASGFPKDRVVLCGPLRYESLIRYAAARPEKASLRSRLQLPADVTIVFIALAIVEADTQALFGALVEALGGDLPRDLHFVVRTHPNRPGGDPALRATLDTLGPERASLAPPGAAVYDYIAASDAMIGIGSMIAFEAMALGVMPIAFDNPATYGAVSLAEYEDGLFVPRSPAALREALDHVVRQSAVAAAKRSAWPALLARVFGDLGQPAGDQFGRALDALAAPARTSVS